MALAKYYEDILERLLEENHRLSGKLTSNKLSKPSAKDASRALSHVTAHLKASKKALNELLSLLTDPQHKPRFTLYEAHLQQYEMQIQDAARVIAEKDKKIEKLRNDLRTTQLTVDELKKELALLKLQAENYEEKILKMKNTLDAVKLEKETLNKHIQRIEKELEDTRKLVMKSCFPDIKPLK